MLVIKKARQGFIKIKEKTAAYWILAYWIYAAYSCILAYWIYAAALFILKMFHTTTPNITAVQSNDEKKNSVLKGGG